MKRWIGLAAFVILLAVGAGLAVREVAGWLTGPSAAAPQAGAGPEPSAESLRAAWAQHGYRTEEEWIVGDIADGIAGMAAYARTGADAVTADSLPAVTVRSNAPLDSLNGRIANTTASFVVTTSPGDQQTIAITDHLWSPDHYAALAAHLLGDRRPASPETPAALPETFLLDLADLRLETLLVQNERISTALQHDMASPDVQEQAALLVAALTLRESAARFDDPRSQLSRITAHLALAQALRTQPATADGTPSRAPSSLAGTLARAILLGAIGREQEAMNAVAEVERDRMDRGAQAWARALRLRFVGDWREGLPATPAPTRLERLQYARALWRRRGMGYGMDYVDRVAPADMSADWSRLMLGQTDDFTVDIGNRYVFDNLSLEASEIEAAWAATGGPPLDKYSLLTHLNDDPARSPIVIFDGAATVQVLDWGRWAAFLQRHLCAALVAVSARDTQQDYKDGDRLSTELESAYTRLRLFPLVSRAMARNQAEYTHALQTALPLVTEHPTLITAATWSLLRDHPGYPVGVNPIPPPIIWFAPNVPTGTGFDLGSRIVTNQWHTIPTQEQFARWIEMAPHDCWLPFSKLKWGTQGRPSVADSLRVLAAVTDYDAYALGRIYNYATEGSYEEYVPVARKACEIDADQCDKLAWQLVTVGQDEEAATVYDRYIAEARDRVRVANSVDWVVNYHFEHGRQARAQQIATLAADTGSSAGLDTLAHLLERAGRYADAEQLYRKANARYPDSSARESLGLFCLRQANRADDDAYMKEAEALLNVVLREALEPLTPASTQHAPLDGILAQKISPRAARLGLQEGDIIVGLNGQRVRTFKGYRLTAAVSLGAPVMKLIVWRQGAYQELALTVPQGLFAMNFVNYTPQSAQR